MHLRHKLLLLLILTAVAGMALPALRAPVFLDDEDELVHVQGMQSPAQVLGTDCYGFFRPVKNALFYAFDRGLPGRPDLWRAISLLVYLATVLLALRLFGRLLPGPGAALAATAVWALAPTQVASLAWVSCLNILLMTACCFAALAAYDDAVAAAAAGRRRAAAGASLLLATAYALALLSYESAVAFPALLVVWEVLRRGRPRLRGPLLPAVLGSAALTLLYLAVRHLARGNAVIDNESFGPVAAWQVSLASAHFTMDHVLTWLWPFGRQSITGTFLWTGNAEQLLCIAAAWVALLLAVVLAWRLRTRLPRVTGGLAFFALAFLPTSNLVPFRNGPFADYYLVLPSFGLALAATGAGLAAARRALDPAAEGRGTRRLAWAVLALLVAWRTAAAALGSDWARAWRRESVLFERTLAVRPDAFTARASLARTRMAEGRLEEAVALAETAVAQAPWHGQGHYVLGLALLRQGRIDDARAALEAATAVSGNHPFPHIVLGVIADNEDGDAEAAKAHYRQALQLRWTRNSATAALNLGVHLAQEKRLDEAIEVMQGAVLRGARNPALFHNLATACEENGEPERAARYRARAERLSAPAAAR